MDASGSDDADVRALVGVLLLLRDFGLEASRMTVGRIALELLPRSQMDDEPRQPARTLPFDASGGRLKS